jgi:23S rRNA (pseudouridine1915-N3)-methyltransferase
MRIRFLWVGKTKNSLIKSLISDYLDRIRHFVPCEVVEIRDLSKRRIVDTGEVVENEGEELSRHLPEHGRIIALSENGVQFTSFEFARWIEAEQNRGTRVVTFVIGGPEGLSTMISDEAHLNLSMGKMTWTHEMCRVLVVEQVYRALCIIRRIPYHKG